MLAPALSTGTGSGDGTGAGTGAGAGSIRGGGACQAPVLPGFGGRSKPGSCRSQAWGVALPCGMAPCPAAAPAGGATLPGGSVLLHPGGADTRWCTTPPWAAVGPGPAWPAKSSMSPGPCAGAPWLGLGAL